MASFCSRQIPSVFFKKPEDLLDLQSLDGYCRSMWCKRREAATHSQMIKELLREWKTAQQLVGKTKIIVGLAGEHPQTTVRRRRNFGEEDNSAVQQSARALDSRGHHSWLEHGVHRRHGRQRGPARFAGEPARHCRRCAVGD